jgi:hemolysin-activating ACP:hemolysin acyltransferase
MAARLRRRRAVRFIGWAALNEEKADTLLEED